MAKHLEIGRKRRLLGGRKGQKRQSCERKVVQFVSHIKKVISEGMSGHVRMGHSHFIGDVKLVMVSIPTYSKS